ncbi:UvrD-helicase domain-containing protein [Pseudoalteromonas sp. 2CM36K]|uniref:UvrD-helicase domain-containing protein n=1 Tax=Pseudoalteromonas sp. 2CM36K TaxID=2929854 RepID=UPI0020BFDA2F|nr:UvrD-helicase domain-containing protein [Pseudoalteromonas sp. 2CM36K]MCK8102005.1 AAA family ATPase [Pseudoalteromonas sp. 2CM36K]
MKQELAVDFETFSQKSDTPVFHKIKFDETSIYLTKSFFYESGIPNTGKNHFGNYRLFSWADARAKAFLGFELGQESPALGIASVIGSFTPLEDDLRDVKYVSGEGKAYFKSALAELEGKNIEEESSVKVDAENFMKMKEIIPTGAQGKAIYGDGDYIIDGPAGTGKSTTVLQKIKLLEVQEKINPTRIQVIVKNSKVVPRFKELLAAIDIFDISIFPVGDFIARNYSNTPSVGVNELSSLNKLAVNASDIFNFVFDTKALFTLGYQLNQNNWDQLCNVTKNDTSFISAAKSFLEKAEEVRESKKVNLKSIADKQAELKRNTDIEKEKLTRAIIKKNEKSLLRRLGKRIGFNATSNESVLSLGDEANIREQLSKYKNRHQEAIEKFKLRFDEQIHLAEQSLVNELESIKEVFVKAVVKTTRERNEAEILRRYFNKNLFRNYPFHTIIVDEAQDVSSVDIELIRLCTQNTILAGDESQTENPDGIGLWSNLAIENTFTKNDNLNIYQLRHNFRQTYELGNVSYNYRQLILGRGIEDIKSDYFEDQMGFNKPSLRLISAEEDFVHLVKARINYIKVTFSSSFPLVIFYENSSSLQRFKTLLKGEKFTICNDENLEYASDILFVNIWEIAGREFPVVLAPLTESTSANTIYIMLSRAKFDLTFFTGAGKTIDPYILLLCQHGLISK